MLVLLSLKNRFARANRNPVMSEHSLTRPPGSPPSRWPVRTEDRTIFKTGIKQMQGEYSLNRKTIGEISP